MHLSKNLIKCKFRRVGVCRNISYCTVWFRDCRSLRFCALTSVGAFLTDIKRDCLGATVPLYIY